MEALIHDLRAAFNAALNEWRRCRWMREAMRSIDDCPF